MTNSGPDLSNGRRGEGRPGASPSSIREGEAHGNDVAQTIRVPHHQDPKLVHYLEGHHIIRHSHAPFRTGGFCDIFTGDHPTYGKVALRRPRMTEDGYTWGKMKDFCNESAIWKRLRHPNILAFLGLIQSDGHIWAVSHWAENGTLPTYLKENPRVDRCALAFQLADAIRYLHRQEVVHGDIKGSNILISAAGTVLLCDFGLSKLSGTLTSSSLSGAASIRWCAPEVLFDEKPKSFASDVYSFGMTVYEILSGNVPLYLFSTEVSVITAIKDGVRPPTKPMFTRSGDSYRKLWAVASQSWDSNPSNRSSMTVICERLGIPFTSVCDATTGGTSTIKALKPHWSASNSSRGTNDIKGPYGNLRAGRPAHLDQNMSKSDHVSNAGPLTTPLNELKTISGALQYLPDELGAALVAVKACFNLSLMILGAAENSHANARKLCSLENHIAQLRSHIKNLLGFTEATREDYGTVVVDRVIRLQEELDGVTARLLPLRHKGLVGRLANHVTDTMELEDLNAHLDRIIKMSMLEEILTCTVNAEQTQPEIPAANDIPFNQANVSQTVRTADDDAIHRLPRAKARYDSSLRRGARRCLEGTRVEFLETLHEWIDGIGPHREPVFWLSGEAGTGKSTIAHTIAEDRDKSRQLGVSFFFSRNEEARRDANLFISTLAYQLSLFDKGFKACLAVSLRDDPTLPEKNIKIQLREMVMEPLRKTTTLTGGPIVIVVDALDECSPDAGAEEILEAWAELIRDFPLQFRLLITSRPSWYIKMKIESAKHMSRVFHLHDISETVVKSDIEHYLRESLANVLDGGLARGDLTILLERIGLLFILASTYVKYIKDPIRSPRHQLLALLSRKSTLGVSPVAELDILYLDIVQCIPQGSNPQSVIDAFRKVVGAMVVAGIPMTPIQLSNLLAMDLDDVAYILKRLSAVIFLSEVDIPVSFFHQSFSEFLTDPLRCTDRLYAISKSQAHLSTALQCFDIFDQKFQVGSELSAPDQTEELPTSDDTHPGSAIPTQDSEIPEAISLSTSKAYPDYLCYASVYLSYHLQGTVKGEIRGESECLARFESFYMLHRTQWLDVITSLSDITGLNDIPARLHRGFINYYQLNGSQSPRIMDQMLSFQRELQPHHEEQIVLTALDDSIDPSSVVDPTSGNDHVGTRSLDTERDAQYIAAQSGTLQVEHQSPSSSQRIYGATPNINQPSPAKATAAFSESRRAPHAEPKSAMNRQDGLPGAWVLLNNLADKGHIEFEITRPQEISSNMHRAVWNTIITVTSSRLPHLQFQAFEGRSESKVGSKNAAAQPIVKEFIKHGFPP